jgi:hypothetical protein
MTRFGWIVLENIAWCAAGLVCFLLLDDWWKLLGFAMLAMSNTFKTAEVAPPESPSQDTERKP